MDKMKKVFLVGLTLLGLILTGCSQAVAEQDIAGRIQNSENPVITWGTKADQNLFGQYNVDSGKIEGFDVDLAYALTDEMTDGQGTAVIVEATSKTRIPLLKNGNIDAIAATLTITEGRLEEVLFSDVYFNGGQSLLVPEDSPLQGLDDLDSSHTMLAVKGSNSTQNFRELKPEVEVRDLENYAEAFVALQAGQGDAMTGDNTMALGLIDQNPGFRLAGENFTTEPYGVAVNLGQEDFQTMIDEALDAIIENGTYNEIYNKWFGEYLPKEDAASELPILDDFVKENVYGDGDATVVDPAVFNQAE